MTPSRRKSAHYSLHNNAPSSRKLLKMDVLTSETCWAVNWHNKQVSSSWSTFIQKTTFQFLLWRFLTHSSIRDKIFFMSAAGRWKSPCLLELFQKYHFFCHGTFYCIYLSFQTSHWLTNWILCLNVDTQSSLKDVLWRQLLTLSCRTTYYTCRAVSPLNGRTAVKVDGGDLIPVPKGWVTSTVLIISSSFWIVSSLCVMPNFTYCLITCSVINCPAQQKLYVIWSEHKT